MIQEDYVSFETAKLLKEKGFNELTPLSYSLPYGYESHVPCCNNVDTDFVSRITMQMAMKWLRVEKLLDISVYSYSTELSEYVHGWSFFIHKLSFEDGRWNWDDSVYAAIDKKSSDDKIYETYEEACESAIGHCLENLI